MYMVINTEEKLIAIAASAARLAYEDGEGIIPVGVEEVVDGASFIIDLMIPTEVESGDGRKLLSNSLSTRDLPIPLLWQPKTGTGHDGSFIVGRIDSCDVTPEGIKNARGVFDTGPYGREAERLVRNGMLRGISADLDMFEPVSDEEMSQMSAESGEDTTNKLWIKKARTMAATLLPKPAFQECTIRIVEDFEELDMPDGLYEVDTDFDETGDSTIAALIASAIPVSPPKEWFDNPGFKTETPLTIDESGRVYGHCATWVQDHIGNMGVRPPRSRSSYAYFHTGLVRTSEGVDVPVGQLTLAGGHAALDKSANEAVSHYDNTSSAVADVHVGEDAYGIWVAGALRPGVSPEQVRVMRASSPSGDWRPINGKLELVAILHVNVPGFPIARACVASGSVTALVAAGASTLYRIKHSEDNKDFDNISARLQGLEATILSEKKEMAIKRMKADSEERKAALVASVESLKERFAPELEAREAQRQELANQVEELRARVEEFKVGIYDEAKHPRHRDGRWRKVLGRLSDLLNDDDSGADEAIKHAVDAEEVGDEDEARAAGREAKVSLAEALERETDPTRRGRLEKAIEAVDDAVKSSKNLIDIEDSTDADDESLLEAGIAAAVEKIIDELIGENLDPKAIADRAFNSLKHYVDSKKITVEDLTKLIADKIEKKFTPGIMQ